MNFRVLFNRLIHLFDKPYKEECTWCDKEFTLGTGKAVYYWRHEAYYCSKECALEADVPEEYM